MNGLLHAGVEKCYEGCHVVTVVKECKIRNKLCKYKAIIDIVW